MKFSVSLAILIFTATFARAEEEQDIYVGCRGDLEIGPQICDKFNFLSSEESVKKGCVNPVNGTTFYDLSDLPMVESIDANTRKMASMITNVFEDGDPYFAFASCSDIGDLRGYTCGYAGFTTGTGDAETLIQSFAAKNASNQLNQFLPTINKISNLPHCDRKHRGDTSGLEKFCEAWKQEACDLHSGFSELQRDWVYENYMIPSARYAAQSGVHSPLGQAIFYDTIIQHGFQYVEPDINIVRVLVLTGPREANESEQAFLTRFLTTRRELQCCYPDKVWPASATRSQDWLTLIQDFEYNKDLNVPIKLKNFQVTVTGTEDATKDVKRCV